MHVIINEQSKEQEKEQQEDVVQHTRYNKSTRQFEQYSKFASSKSEVRLFDAGTVMLLKDVTN